MDNLSSKQHASYKILNTLIYMERCTLWIELQDFMYDYIFLIISDSLTEININFKNIET